MEEILKFDHTSMIFVNFMYIFCFLQVPTVEEMYEHWKKKHNFFGILYSWFMAEACFNVWQSYLSSCNIFQLIVFHPILFNVVLVFQKKKMLQLLCTIIYLFLNFCSLPMSLTRILVLSFALDTEKQSSMVAKWYLVIALYRLDDFFFISFSWSHEFFNSCKTNDNACYQFFSKF